MMLVREDQRMLAGFLDTPELHSPDPNANYGEVFTRRWVVDFILDLVGYTPDRDLGAETLVEPSCGTGAFLVAIVERLIASSKRHGRNLRDLGPCIRAFDLLKSNVYAAQATVTALLAANGLDDSEAENLSAEWIASDDFLLRDYERPFADYVIGNPPYIRLEHLNRRVMQAYRESCSTMRGRADIYVGFIERGLKMLNPEGTLSFICADRWMRNQYGADLREMVTRRYAVDTVVSMHDVDAFEDEVSAYPAIVVLRHRPQQKAAVVDTNATFGEFDASRVAAWVRRGRKEVVKESSFEASRVDSWFSGRDLWPSGSPAQLALIAELEARFPPLQDAATGTRVGIGVATGCDDVFITSDADLVEKDRLLPLLQAPDITTGSIDWSERYLVNPWNGEGLVDLDSYPRLARYMDEHSDRLRARHVAKKRPEVWYRTIDRVHQPLAQQPKLVMPDMKAAAHPVLDNGGYYPHHNLYYIVSDQWDLEVLGGLLLSDIANLFVGAYCVRMRGGTYRFQAQYIRRIRVPRIRSINRKDQELLAAAFANRDREMATDIARRVYKIQSL